MWATDVEGQGLYLLRAFPDYLVLDRMKTWADRRKEPEWERLRDVPVTDIASIEVDLIASAASTYSWKWSTGFLHGADKTPAVTGILVTLRSGERSFFRVVNMAPIEVRAALGPAPRPDLSVGQRVGVYPAR